MFIALHIVSKVENRSLPLLLLLFLRLSPFRFFVLAELLIDRFFAALHDGQDSSDGQCADETADNHTHCGKVSFVFFACGHR
jgi:hypothetical protein